VTAARFILVGRVAGAHGVKGEVRITTFTNDPMALVGYKDLKHADGALALELTGGRLAKGGIVARVRQAETRDQADALRGLELYIARDALPSTDEDEFYLADLIGLEAHDANGVAVGRVKAVENFGAGDLLEIAPADGGATWWLPFTSEAVPEVRIAEGSIIVVRPAEDPG
jgi:16S rRNA processing protein RimM